VTATLRQAVLALTSVLAVAVVCAVAWTPRPRAETPPLPAVQPSTAPAPAEPDGDGRDAMPERNVFRFVEPEPEEPPPPRALAPLMVPPPLAPLPVDAAASEPIRLVGFVRRAGAVRAALSLDGSVSVVGVGDEAGGYSVLAVDEDAGVTVRAPDGAELLLAPPPR
jgi:hypothetical protein